MALLPTAEDRSVGRSVTLQRHQGVPNALWDQDRASLVSLAEHGDLSGVVTLLQVPPLQRTNLRDSESASVERQQDRPVPRIRFQRDDAQHFGLAENAFCQFVTKAGELQRPAHVELEVAKLEAEGEQALHGAQAAMH